jgi:hypothetical protein
MSKKIAWIIFYTFIWLSFFQFQKIHYNAMNFMPFVYAFLIALVGWLILPYKMFFPLNTKGICHQPTIRKLATFMIYFMFCLSFFQIKDMLFSNMKENTFILLFSTLGGIVFESFFNKRPLSPE